MYRRFNKGRKKSLLTLASGVGINLTLIFNDAPNYKNNNSINDKDRKSSSQISITELRSTSTPKSIIQPINKRIDQSSNHSIH